jgi:predicted CXXCH cytochrome family protein
MWPKFKYIIIVLFFSLIWIVSACSYKTLSVFFDGVPNPRSQDPLIVASNYSSNPTENDRINEVKALKSGPDMNYHIPYQDKACTACHDENLIGKFILPEPDLCYQCHVDFSTKYTVLHVPVEMGECTSCHSPHMAENRKLLLKTGQQLCLNCHDAGDIMKKESHDGIGDSDCIECHNPHGGSEAYLLN